MVTHKNGRPSGTRKPSLHLAAKILAALLVMLSSVSCQFIGTDMFPTTLSREDAVLDLDATLADMGVSGEFEVTAMTFLTSPTTGKEYIFVTVSAITGMPRLVILDANNLDLVKVIQSNNIGNVHFVDMDNYFLTGNNSGMYRFDTATLQAVSNQPITFPSGYQSFTAGTQSLRIWYDTTDLYTVLYTANWATPVTLNKMLNSVPIPNLSLNSLYYEGSRVCLLFSSSNKSNGYILSFPSRLDFTSAFSSASIFGDAAATVATIPSGDDQSGWLTRNGAIILTHENDTRLVRYESDSGKELDSFSLNNTENTRFTFSADGKQWLMYDGRRGKLHLLRTWW